MEQNSYYNACFAKCSCFPDSERTCAFPGSESLSRSFAKMRENGRVGVVRGMLLSLASPKGETNDLFERSGINKKQKDDSKNSVTRYAIKGKVLCRHGFMAIKNVSSATLSRHSRNVAESDEFTLYSNRRGESHRGKLSLQTEVAILFLRTFWKKMDFLAHRGKARKTKIK